MAKITRKSWNTRLEEITNEVRAIRSTAPENYVVFRGQSNYDWHLTPSLYVAQKNCGWSDSDREVFEYNIYFDFITSGKGYITNNMSSWEILVEMRHFGLPVRVLDWTEGLNMALYFAIIDSKVNQDFSKRVNDAALFVLDPYTLNEKTMKVNRIYNPLDKNFFDFEDVVLEGEKHKFSNKIMEPYAIIMPRRSERIIAQRGLFTVQGMNDKCLDEINKLKSVYKKIRIEKEFFPEIAEYLETSGLNHFTVYPDFQGLAMSIKEYYKLERN